MKTKYQVGVLLLYNNNRPGVICEIKELSFDNEEKAKKYIEKHSIDNKYHKEHYSITETETI